MSTTRIATATLAATAAAALWLAGPAHAETIAADPAPVVLAQDTTPAPATVPANVVGIDSDVIAGLTVTGHRGKPVAVAAPGHPTRVVTAPASKGAVITGLTPGVRYTVTIAGRKIGTAIPLAQVGPASGLRVETTSTRGTVLVTWTHTATAGEGRDITYDVTATPINADGTDGNAVVTTPSTTTTATLADLDTTVRYRFTATPHNTASTGRPSTATMTTTLDAITGTTTTPRTPAPVVTTAVPTPAPAPSPAPAPAPATRTIYVCPADTTPNGDLCRKVSSYTWDLKAYTYHPESYTYTAYGAPYTVRTGEIGPGPTCPAGWNPAWDTDPILGSVNPHCEQTRQDPYAATGSRSVKDTAPAGYTDTGSTWTKKNPAPAGYTDDGSQWIIDLPKIAQVIPA